MPVPNFPVRMNLVDIVIRRINTATTVVDRDFRETRATTPYLAAITLRGQVNFGDVKFKRDVRSASRTGDQELSLGHILFKKKYLDGLGIVLKNGDAVDSIAGAPMDMLIKEVRYESPLRGVFLFVYCEIEKRQRSR